MLTKISVCEQEMPTVCKTVSGADASTRGAFAVGDDITFTVDVPRRLGTSAVVLRLCEDGGVDRDLPMRFVSTEGGVDIYELILDTASLCGAVGEGLFYYEILFLRGWDTLFTHTENNVTFTLGPRSDGRFLLLLHKKEFDTPAWFKGNIMYHVFVDRFCRGEGKVGTREDAVLNEDWQNGVPQYPEKNGDAFSNNVFFGGNLWGVAEKLDYLKSLGVGVIYLSPIFRAYSNHKYDTGDYLRVDEMFGGEEAFDNLLEKATEKGIRIILDGVFNHTGDDSRYFDRYGKYGGTGAYSNPNSPFRDWFRFRRYPQEYETWWGIQILPKLNLENESCKDFFVGRGGVIEKYVKRGIGGWRLDVADELPNEFLDTLRLRAKGASNNEAVIIGEVWENAAEKISYGKRRRYLRGDQLDSVMNYPFRNGVLAFLMDGDGKFFADVLQSVYATYPKCVCDALMNLLGTHDTERIMTVLGEGHEGSDEENCVLATKRLPKERRAHATALLKLAAVLQYTVYGIPSIFYGDEIGLEGHHDPFCRRPYPWGGEDEALLAFYRRLGALRCSQRVLCDGEFALSYVADRQIAYTRGSGADRLTVVVNASDTAFEFLADGATDLLHGVPYEGVIPPLEAVILKESEI